MQLVQWAAGGVLVSEVGLLDFIFLLLLLCFSGFDMVAGTGSVLTGLMGDMLLFCGLVCGNLSLIGELGTGVRWVTIVLISSRPANLIASGSAALIAPGLIEAAAL